MERNGIWKNMLLAALLTGVVAFWGGFALSEVQKGKTLDDHEARLRILEKTLTELGGDVREIRNLLREAR